MRKTIGIDIGGTGIKAAIVDIDSGVLVSERLKEATPTGATPHDVAAVVARLVEQLDPQGSLPIGVAFPAIIVNEVALSAANVSAEWINLHVGDLLEKPPGAPRTWSTTPTLPDLPSHNSERHRALKAS